MDHSVAMPPCMIHRLPTYLRMSLTSYCLPMGMSLVHNMLKGLTYICYITPYQYFYISN